MPIRLAAGMHRIGTETAFAVLARARELEAQGRSIVHMQIGEPDFDTPEHIIQAAIEALQQGWTHYGPAQGDPELREAIASYIVSTRQAPYTANQVIVTPGGKPIMFFAMLALLQPGDEAIYPDPGFPIYGSMIEYTGATAVPIQLREANEFRVDVDELRTLVTPRTRLLILNSPGNPCGNVLTRSDIEAIAEIALEHDLVVLADEIYAELLYEGEHVSIASLPGMAERTILLDGFSKTFAMTGWRMGYGLVPEELVGPMTTLMVNSASCTNVAAQRAGIAALTGPWEPVHAFLEAFRRRRQLLVDGLNEIPGVTCVMPHGAFYAFPNVSLFGMKSDELAGKLLDEFGVAAVSGTSFGAAGEGYIRLSYATSDDNIREALTRIASASAAWS
ncbi:MAG: pyridoxal phosphate-dependent aminotransferase [Thermomicrobiales bacterium]|nr:pyridoxal phosphate-dependent aminotransferase [Thermomicrobiales bacterium]MCO5218140.1 pyridoxal phosphate-dependent aminotransferase [Thermomicrobiales bacterium]